MTRRSPLSVGDLLYEAASSLASSPARTALTSLGVSVGVATLVATVGISLTAGNHIVDRLSESRPTSIRIEAPADDDDDGRPSAAIPWQVEDRLAQLSGVVTSGAWASVPSSAGLVSATPLEGRTIAEQQSLATLAVTPGLTAAAELELAAGRAIDAGDVAAQRDVVVLGSLAARRFNISTTSIRPAVYLGDELFTVIGIVESSSDPLFLDAVLLPYSTAEHRYDVEAPTTIIVVTDPGAIGTVSKQAPVALVPTSPTSLTVRQPVDPASLRRDIEAEVNGLFLALGLLTLLAGSVAVANATLSSVLERTSELGLRRALGASRRQIVGQLLAESGIVGFAGSCVGVTVGILVTVATAVVKGWTPVLTPTAPFLAGALGIVTALASSLLPTRRAVRLAPVEALRS